MPINQPVFVIFPLQDAQHVQEHFDNGIFPALKKFGFDARMIDNRAVRGGIIDAIRKEIAESYFIIADLTYERPNCYYELGYAQALGKDVFLIKKDGTDVHFNISNQMVHSYTDRNTLQKVLEVKIPSFLLTDKREAGDSLNGLFGRQCIRDQYRLTAQVIESTNDRCLLTFEVISLDPQHPLTSPVVFCMHDSFTHTRQKIRPRSDGVARYEEVESGKGPWTLGAEIVETGTKLELDLATIPGARSSWYRKAYKKI